VYQRALQVELQRGGLQAELEHKIQVRYKGVIGGDFEADLFVGHAVMVEIKVAPQYNPSDAAQLLNELKATGVKVSLLINFGRAKVEFKRLVF
jgi:GxxExxY protein